ncbi:Sterol 3-beta-glucosyltransferase [Sphaceloma murrayae]|uniref:Sterol 3-beta-glucosyltransferase n=1 Tax=Sphaceloma murrayae TaxID=2082308 RepID=A0A2K1R2R4_9PEZI|nr:Sterol 3-beta-glucosyltransferase [Sphaceloma murrayae]
MVSDQKAAASNAEGGVDPMLQNVVAQAAAVVEGNAEDERRGRHTDPPPPNQGPSQTEDASRGPPPAYGDEYFEISNDDRNLGVNTSARLTEDGRVNININQRSRRLSNILVPALHSQLEGAHDEEPLPPPYIPASLGGEPGQDPPPPMNVVIHVVGSRGDVQPFVALGKVLKETYGHRVRIATHPTFQEFVLENGLEYFSIGGDPAELMAFMVKNPGLMPGFDTLRSGDVGKRRKEIATMIKGCWRSCIETGDGTGVEVTDDTVEEWMSTTTASNHSSDPRESLMRPFIADAIIANPPSFAHIHCAEKLGCPLHIMFTMPYSPTQAFPHPLANIQSSNADPNITNFMSYGMVDMMTWQGLGDIVNRFRQSTLGLDPVSLIWAPGMLARLHVPHTYCWSPALIPKPKDWKRHISISGFYFLSLASNFTPQPELDAFLKAGPPPVYIGFGSIVVDDPTAMTKMIFDAVKMTGQRALVSKGWGGIGADELGIPEGVMMLGNVPHDWLFQRVSAVVHHGGAGTTAAGIAAGKPTVIVPFFGDQPFWGAMIAKAGAGPEPIAYKDLDADKLATSIKTALLPATLDRARELAAQISSENGCHTGAQSFHQQMEVDKVRCTLAPSRIAVWRLRRTKVRLSALAATVLGNEGLLDFKDLKLFRSKEYEPDTGPVDPVSGGASAIIGTASSMLMGFADFPVEALKALHVHPATAKKGKGKEKDTDKDTASQTSSDKQGISGSHTPRTSTENVSLTDTRTSDAASMRSQESITSPLSSQTSNSQFNLNESLARLQSSDSTEQRPDPGSRTTSMRQALRDQLSNEFVRRTSDHSSSRSQSRRRSSSPFRRTDTERSNPIDTVVGTSKGVGRILDASFRSPMDFSHALAKGFHNAPRLYGDDTVRKSDKITDFKSGIRAAGKEFGFGMYDGITGIFTQPVSGAKKEGAAGFIKGIGKGIGGIVLKPQAAVFGIPGYMMKGVYKELQGTWGKSVQNYIIAARTAQGFEDWHLSTHEERSDIVQRWAVLTETLKKKKNIDEVVMGWGKEKRDDGVKKRAERRRKIKEHLDTTDFRGLVKKANKSGDAVAASGKLKRAGTSPAPIHRDTGAETPSDVDVLTPASSFEEPRELHHASTFPGLTARSSETTVHRDTGDDDLERAIQRSIQEASTGNQEDDEMLERAIRESVRQLEEHPLETGEEEAESRAIEAAMQASLREAEKMGMERRDVTGEFGGFGTLTGGGGEEVGRGKGGVGLGKAGVDGDGRGQETGVIRPGEGEDEEQRLADAIRQSLQDHESREREKTEEEIVLEYVKKQSLREEEHRRNMTGGGGGAEGGRNVDAGEGGSGVSARSELPG